MSVFSNKYTWKLVLPVPIFVIIAMIFSMFALPDLIEKNARQSAISTAKLAAAQFTAVRSYYTQNVINKVLADGNLTPSYDHKETEDRVPLPATFIHDLSALLAEKNINIALYSPDPFPNRKGRKLDETQQLAWDFLNTNPKKQFVRQQSRGGHQIVRVAIADTMTSNDCVECHNTRADTPKNDWKLADVRGVLEVQIVIDEQLSNGQILSNSILIGIFCVGILLTIITVSIARQVIRTDIAQFEKSKLDAEAVSKLKSEFLSTASHELRTPLTSIKGAIGLVINGATGEVSPKAISMLQLANNNIKRLTLLVNDILDIEKFEVGDIQFDLQPVNLSDLVNEVIKTNIGLAKEHDVLFELVDTDASVIVIGDSNRLSQVVLNLLSNAAKFSGASKIVNVSVTQHNNQATISITDRGCGIPDEFSTKIFEKFTQIDASDTRKLGGTGLGLSISKSIIDNHEGTLTYESVVNVGTTFYVTLPTSK